MAEKKQKGVMSKVMPKLLGMMDGWEQRVVQIPDSYKAVPDSPVRFEIMKEGMKRGKGGPGQEAAGAPGTVPER